MLLLGWECWRTGPDTKFDFGARGYSGRIGTIYAGTFDRFTVMMDPNCSCASFGATQFESKTAVCAGAPAMATVYLSTE